MLNVDSTSGMGRTDGATTFSRMALSITTLSIMGLFETLGITVSSAECRYAECRFSIVMLSVIMLEVVVLRL
jgi:hypothetical protein